MNHRLTLVRGEHHPSEEGGIVSAMSACEPMLVPREYLEMDHLNESFATAASRTLESHFDAHVKDPVNLNQLQSGGLINVTKLQLTIDLKFRQEFVAQASKPYQFSEDLLDLISADLKGKLTRGFSVGIPIFTMVAINFHVKPQISLPMQLRAQMQGEASFGIMMSDKTWVFDLVDGKKNTGTETGLDFKPSYIKTQANLIANAGLRIETAVVTTLELCLATACGGINFAVKHDMAMGVDFGIGNNKADEGGLVLGLGEKFGEFDLDTYYTDYCEYPEKKLPRLTGGGVAVAVGFYYYVTLPAFQVTASYSVIAGLGGDSTVLFDTVAKGTLKDAALTEADTFFESLSAEQRKEDTGDTNLLVKYDEEKNKFTTPYFARDAIAFGTDLKKGHPLDSGEKWHFLCGDDDGEDCGKPA